MQQVLWKKTDLRNTLLFYACRGKEKRHEGLWNFGTAGTIPGVIILLHKLRDRRSNSCTAIVNLCLRSWTEIVSSMGSKGSGVDWESSMRAPTSQIIIFPRTWYTLHVLLCSSDLGSYRSKLRSPYSAGFYNKSCYTASPICSLKRPSG